MPINHEDVKAVIRQKLNSIFPNVTLVCEGNVSDEKTVWITEQFHSMKTVYETESLPILKGSVEYQFCSRSTSSPGTLADTAAASLQPHSAPVCSSTLAVFIEECSCSGIEYERAWRKVRLTLRFSAVLK